MMKVLAFVALFLATATATQVIEKGLCPDVQTVQTFDASNYVGKWYEYEKYPFLFEAFGRCITAEYSANADKTIAVKNSQITFGIPNSVQGTASFTGPSNVAKLSVTFTGFPGKGTYWVVDTDYINYSVVWSCTQITPLLKALNSWILTRARVPTAEVVSHAYAAIVTNNIPQKYFQRTDQSSCTN